MIVFVNFQEMLYNTMLYLIGYLQIVMRLSHMITIICMVYFFSWYYFNKNDLNMSIGMSFSSGSLFDPLKLWWEQYCMTDTVSMTDQCDSISMKSPYAPKFGRYKNNLFQVNEIQNKTFESTLVSWSKQVLQYKEIIIKP